MDAKQIFFLDLLTILPGEVTISVECYATNLNTPFGPLFSQRSDCEFIFELNQDNRAFFYEAIASHEIIDCFSYVAITKPDCNNLTRVGDKLLFEAHDAIENGATLSNSVTIPLWFNEKYEPQKDMYCVSQEW